MFDQLLPLHPKLVHFPIALFCVALMLDLISCISARKNLHEAAVIIYVVGALLTPLVVWAGLFEQQRLNLHHPVLEQHKFYAFITMGVSLISLPVLWFLKRTSFKSFRIIFKCFLLSLAILVTVTGYWGGRMVYEYGAGVSQ